VRGIFVREQVEAVSVRNKVAVVHLQRGGGRFRVEGEPGLPFALLRVRYPRSPLAYPLHFLGAVLALRRLRRGGFEPDVIHAHFFLAAFPPLLLRSLFRLPVVVSEHWSVFLPEDPATLGPGMLRAARLALSRAAYVLPASDALRRGMEAHGIKAQYRVVPNIVNTALFHPGDARQHDRRRLLFVGLLYEAKNIAHLLRATALLTRRHADVELEIVGDGPDRPDAEALAAELAIAERVHFTGLQTKPEVARRMRESDLFVLTSRYENNPCAVIEALASGLPVVATRVGGLPELIDASNGRLSDPASVEDTADQVQHMLGALPDFDRKEIARRAADRFGANAVTATLESVYADAVGILPRRD